MDSCGLEYDRILKIRNSLKKKEVIFDSREFCCAALFCLAVEGAPVTCVLIFTHVIVTTTGAFNRIE